MNLNYGGGNGTWKINKRLFSVFISNVFVSFRGVGARSPAISAAPFCLISSLENYMDPMCIEKAFIPNINHLLCFFCI